MFSEGFCRIRLQPQATLFLLMAAMVAIIVGIISFALCLEAERGAEFFAVPLTEVETHEPAHMPAVDHTVAGEEFPHGYSLPVAPRSDVMMQLSEAEVARQRAIRNAALDARAERASKELGVTVPPETFQPSSAAEH